MEAPLYSICYVSTADSTVTSENVHTVFDGIIDKNLERSITGILLFSQGNFMQIMEGELDKLSELYQAIQEDPRHHHLIEILSTPIKDRIFENYQTGFSIVNDPESRFKLQVYLRWIEENFDGAIKKRAEIIRPFIY